MKKCILYLWFIIAWMSIGSASVLAAETNCNRRWGNCHVSDVNTIHTDDEDTSPRLLDTIKNAINRCLGILATIVLCVCIYWWFQMLTSGADSKWYDAWRKILKNALLWLAIILLAWMIVSVIFWFVATMSGWNETQSAWVQPVQ